MTDSKFNNPEVLQKAVTGVYFILIFLPSAAFLTGEVKAQEIIGYTRRLKLIGNSFLLAFLAAFGCVIIGIAASAWIHNGALRRKRIRWFFLFLAPVPHYVYALTWMYFVRLFSNIDRRLMIGGSSGLIPCVFVNIMSFTPITTGLILTAMEHHDIKMEEMGEVYASGNKVFRNIVFPAILPVTLASGMLVFVLSVTDFSIPSLFQYKTYTLEIFSEYSRTGNLKQVGILSVPIIIPVLALLFLMSRGLGMIPIRKSKQTGCGLELSGGLKAAGSFAFFLCLLQVVVPLILFLTRLTDWAKLIDSLRLCGKELVISLAIAAFAAVTAVLTAGPAAVWLSNKNQIWQTIALIPMAIPSSLIAMGLLDVVNGSAIHILSQTIYFPALGCAIKYMPFALLIFSARHKRIHKEEMEIARVYMTSKRQYLYRILIPTYMPAIVSAAALVFLLTLGEEGIPLILMPPGYETLAVKVYNYLHYGASELVSGFCLITVVVAAGIFAAIICVNGEKNA